MSNIETFDNHIKIRIEKSKTDIYRRGNYVVIASTGTDLCPVLWLKWYIDSVGLVINSDEYMFRAISFCKTLGVYKLCKKNLPLSYTRAREILLESLADIGLDKSKFGLHSLRSGGVSSGENQGVSDRLLKAHGRWASDKEKDGYITDNLQSQIAVSLNLGI